MTPKERADLGFSDALDDFDPADWEPKTPAAAARPPRAATRQAAGAAGFRSREPQPSSEASQPGPELARQVGAGQGALPRPRRTGRTAQLNLKLRPDTIAAFMALADSQGWGLGETLEHAIAALQAQQRAKGGA